MAEEGSGNRPKDAGGSLPVHGFVLAGGKSSRMGRDKALVVLGGHSLVEIAVGKLTTFCADVSIAGGSLELERFAPVVREERLECGPGAGVEAGLKASLQPWAMFVPVDVPHVPAEFLRLWAEKALDAGMSVSYLGVQGKQPAFCLLQRDCLSAFSAMLDRGERRLEPLLHSTAAADGCASWMYDERDLYGFPEYRGPSEETLAYWFSNLNTPGDLLEAEHRLFYSGY